MAKVTYQSIDGVYTDGNELMAALADNGGRSIPTNLISDGGFELNDGSWTLDATWSIANGVASVVNNSGGTDDIYQTITVAVGTYDVRVSVVNYVTGTASLTYTAGTATLTADSTPTLAANGKLSQKLYVTVAGTVVIKGRAADDSVFGFDNFTCYAMNAETVGNDASTNLITNGTFPTDTTGWTKYESSGTGAISVVSGELLVDNNSSATYTRAVQAITTVVGQSYELKCDLTQVSSAAGMSASESSTGANAFAQDYATSARALRTNFIARATTTYIILTCNSATTTDTATFDNVTCYASNDVIENGEFGANASWTKGTGWTISGGVASVTAPGSSTQLTQSITFDSVGTWEVAIYISSISAGSITNHYTAGTAIITAEAQSSGSAVGWVRRKYYVHSVGTMTISAYASSTAVASIDNISCWLIEDDQSAANDNGFEVHGQLRKLQVAPGADLRAWQGFSANNYLEQPYTSALDVSIFSISNWTKISNTTTAQFIWSRYDADAGGGGFIELYHDVTYGIRALISDDSLATYDTLTGGTSYRDNLWHHYMVVCDGTTFYLYIDGVLVDSTALSAATGDITNTSAVFRIGTRPDTTLYPLLGQIANFKIYGSALTAATIKDIYDSEKTLFQYSAPYAELNGSVDLDIPVTNSVSRGETSKRYTNTALDGTQETLFMYTKDTWNIQTNNIPFQSDTSTDMQQIKHMVNSVKRGQTFTYNERGSFDFGDTARNVILDSADASYSRQGDLVDYYKVNLRLRDA